MNRFSLILALDDCQKRVDNISKVLDDTLTVLDHDAFNLAAEVLAKSERIDFYAGAVPLA